MNAFVDRDCISLPHRMIPVTAGDVEEGDWFWSPDAREWKLIPAEDVGSDVVCFKCVVRPIPS